MYGQHTICHPSHPIFDNFVECWTCCERRGVTGGPDGQRQHSSCQILYQRAEANYHHTKMSTWPSTISQWTLQGSFLTRDYPINKFLRFKIPRNQLHLSLSLFAFRRFVNDTQWTLLTCLLIVHIYVIVYLYIYIYIYVVCNKGSKACI